MKLSKDEQTQQCEICRKVKPLAEFGKIKRIKRGNTWCIPCYLIQKKASTDPEDPYYTLYKYWGL